jgi:hypothetical protein
MTIGTGCSNNEEVGEVKIGKPIETKQDLDFESRFSHTKKAKETFQNLSISDRTAMIQFLQSL